MKQVTVDFSTVTGRIKPMHAVNNGPVGGKVRKTSSNYHLYEEAGIPYARNHDASFYPGYGGEHTVDVHRIFKNFDADETLPESYDFEMTDMYLADIAGVGCETFYRLGASIEHQKRVGTLPPKDFHKWARICEHIIRHYTEGWADGFTYKITYWEIWNEPDLYKNVPDKISPTWSGTNEQFFELYNITASHLKKCFPHLKIGGPAIAYDLDWADRFLAQLTAPLDFFSWHCYFHTFERLVEKSKLVRELLDRHGYTETESILNEWNYVKGWAGEEMEFTYEVIKKLFGSAFLGATMLSMQKTDTDMLMYYDGRPDAWCGLWDERKRPLKGYFVLRMFGRLYRMGTEVMSETDDAARLCVGAAKQGDEGAVMLTHFVEPEEEQVTETVKVSLKGIPAGALVSVEMVDEEHDGEVTREELFTATEAAIYVKMPPASTALLRVIPADAE